MDWIWMRARVHMIRLNFIQAKHVSKKKKKKKGSQERLIFNIPKVQIHNTVTSCESSHFLSLSLKVADKGVAQWRTPLWTGVLRVLRVSEKSQILQLHIFSLPP